jgi:tetratricopeptide (TPR) repeat protein
MIRCRPFLAGLVVLLVSSSAAAQEPVRPLAEGDIVQLLQAGVTPARAATLIEQRGISFDVTPDVETRLRQAGADDALIAAITRAAAPPEEAIRRLTLAELRAKDGDRGAALSELAEAAKLAPHWTELHYRSGLIYESLRQYKQAIAAWRRYLDLRPETPRKPEMVAKLTEWEYRREKQVKAEALVEQGLAAYQKPDWPAALDLYRQATEADPENPDAQTRLAELSLNMRASAASVDDALRYAREAVRLAPESAEAHRQLSRALREKGDVVEAEREARAAVRLAPEASNTHATLAVVLVRQGRSVEAMAEAREALRTQTDDRASQGLVVEIARRKDYASATVLLREFLAARPNDAAARVELGLIVWDQRDIDGAEQQFREAVRLEPGFAYARYNLGRLLWVERKDSPAAIAQAREVVRIAPDNAWHHWLLGSALSDAGQFDEGRRALLESLRIYPGNGAAHWNLGVLYERTGDRAAALREYREAARLEPDNQFYKDGLANAERAR